MNKLKNKIVFLFFIFIFLFSTVCLATDETTNNITSEEITTQSTEENVVETEVTNVEENAVEYEATNVDSEEQSEDQASSSEEEILYSDYNVAGQDFTLDKLVDGNSLAIGNNINVTGQINGDLFIIANSVTIDSDAVIYQNLYVLANEVTINGIANNVYSMSNTFTLGPTAAIYRSVYVMANSAYLYGYINRDAFISAGSLNIPETTSMLIAGNLSYTSNSEISISEGIVGGDITYTPAQSPTIQDTILKYLTRFVALIIFVLLTLLFLIRIIPKSIDRANYNLMSRPFITSGIGILGFVLIPVISILLMTLTVTMPVACTILVIYGILIAFSFTMFAIALSKGICNKFKLEKTWQLIIFSLVSAVVMYALTLIPTVGIFIKLFFNVVGLGIILVSIFNKKSEKEKKEDK